MADAPAAAGTGAAYEAFTTPRGVFAVNWARLTVTTRGTARVKYRGEIVQSTTTASEVAVLEQLADLGALTRGTVVANDADLNWAAGVAAKAEAAAIEAADTVTGAIPASAVQLPVVRAGDTLIAILPA